MTRSTGLFRAVWPAFCLLPFLSVGCGGGADIGPTGEVEGTVTMAGEPLTAGSVAFYQPETGESGGAELDAAGKFKLETPIAVGTYQVSFQPPDAPQPDDEASGKMATENAKMIPEGYQAGDTSDISATVKEGPNTFTFELSKQGPSTAPGDEMAP